MSHIDREKINHTSHNTSHIIHHTSHITFPLVFLVTTSFPVSFNLNLLHHAFESTKLFHVSCAHDKFD